MIEENLDIGDSPQNTIKLPFLRDIEVSQSYNNESERDSRPMTQGFKSKSKSYGTRKSTKEKRVKPMILRNVDGILPEEIYEFSQKKMSVDEIER